MTKRCICASGHHSEYDNLCRYCRENQFSRPTLRRIRTDAALAGLVYERDNGMDAVVLQSYETRNGKLFPEKACKR